MAGAGSEIGRISIKVTPDTDGFRRQTEREINRQMAGVDAEAEIQPNAKGLRARAQRKVSAATKGLVAKADLEVEASLDTKAFNRNLNAMKKRMEIFDLRFAAKVQRFSSDVSFDYKWDQRVQKFLKENVRLREEEKRLADAAAAKRVQAAQAEAAINSDSRADLRRTLSDWDQFIRRHEAWSENFKLVPDFDIKNPNNVRQRLAVLLGRPIDVPINLNVDESAKKANKTMVAALGKSGAFDFSKFTPNFGSGINPAGYAAILAGIALVAAPLIGLITSALLTLPGLISLVLTPIGALALGLDGFKKAAESIKEPFQQLRDSMSAAVESQFLPVFEQLKTIFPTLQAQLPKITQGMADVAQSVVNFLTTGAGKTQVEETIAGIGKSLGDSAPGVRDFTAAIVGLAHEFVTGGALGGVTTWFNETMADFRAWVAQVSADGSLSSAFSGLGDTLKAILDTLGQLATDGFNFVKDPSKVDGFVDSLKDLLSVIESISNLSTKLAPVWDGLDKLFKAQEIFSKLNPFGPDGLKRLNPFGDKSIVVPKNASFWDKVKAGYGFGPDVKAEAEKAGAGVTEAWLGGGVDALKSNPAFKEAITEQLKVGAGQDVTGGALTVAQAQISTNFNAIATQVNTAWTSIITTIMTGANQAIVAMTSTWGQLPLIVQTAFGNLAGFAANGFAQVISTAGTAGNQIVTAFTVPLTQLSGIVVSVFTSLVSTVQSSVGLMVAAVAEGGPKIQAAMQGWGAIILAAGEQMAGIARSSGVAVGNAFAAGIASMTGVVQASAAGLMQAARAFFPNSPADKGPFSGSGWIDKSGESIGIAFADGMEHSSSKVVEMARSLMQAVKDVFGDASGLALNFNFGGFPQQMAGISSAASGFQSSVADSINPTKALTVEGKQQLADLKQQLDLLELQRNELKVQKDQAGTKEAKAAIQAQLDQLNAQRNMLDLQRDQLAYQEKYAGSVSDTANMYDSAISSTMKAPYDFAMANGQQFMQDLGIGGGGALSQLAMKGLEYGSQFVFNVSNIDEAMAVKNNQVNKQAAQYTGR